MKAQAIDTTISTHRTKIADLEREHAGIAVDLVRNPEDGDLQAALAQMETEIASHEKSIARLQIAKVEAQRLDSAEHLKEVAAQATKGRARVAELLPVLLAKDAAIVAAIEALGPMLAERKALADERCALAYAVARHRTRRPQEAPFPSHAADPDVLQPLRRGIAAALWRVGVGLLLNGQPIQPAPKGEPYAEGDIAEAMAETARFHEKHITTSLDEGVAAAQAAAKAAA